MLHEFLDANRAELIDRCRLKVSQRHAPKATSTELEHGIPAFLEQLIKRLRLEQAPEQPRNRAIRTPAGAKEQGGLDEMRDTAARHGRELLLQGFTIDQVVHDYGDLCQVITQMAEDRGASIQVDEFRTLNRCLDDGIADAVTEFSSRRDVLIESKAAHGLTERLGFLAHELRNHLHTATLALTAIRSGNVGLAGATGAALDRSLIGLSNLIDRSLADVRGTAGMLPQPREISLAEFISDVSISAALEARARECELVVREVDPGLAVEVDRDLLSSALGNLLQNAFKFTEHGTRVSLSVREDAGRILIDVEDRCGGLPPGDAEKMFLPFEQMGEDRSGLGLGLSISRRSVEANNGVLRVRNVPGTGCIFTVDLPRCVPREPVPASCGGVQASEALLHLKESEPIP